MHYQRKLSLLDKTYIWHPFTQMQDWVKEDPLIINRGNGVYLYDVKGNKYIDGISSLWVNIHGHRNAKIDRAVLGQLKKISHSTYLGLTHEPGIRCAEQLVKIVPRGLKRVFYSDNGSTAVEISLKMAYQYWQQKKNPIRKKTQFLALTGAYHGDTLGSVAVGGIDLFHKKFHPLLFDVFRAPAPYCYRCPFGKNPRHCAMQCLKKMERILKKYHARIAACVIEPMIQGAAGMIAFPSEYTKGVERLCRKYNVLLIADEVATGFGRTGTMFACEHENIKPDIMCVAKGITGGYLPLAATITTEKIYNAFLSCHENYMTFFHGHSYTANPLACAAASANLLLFKNGAVLRKVDALIVLLREKLYDISQLPHVGDIRRCGVMTGIEVVENKLTKKSYHPKEKIGIKICKEARKYGLIIRPLGDVIVLMPPLSIQTRVVHHMLNIVEKCIKIITQR